jgi:hypothetical protein
VTEEEKEEEEDEEDRRQPPGASRPDCRGAEAAGKPDSKETKPHKEGRRTREDEVSGSQGETPCQRETRSRARRQHLPGMAKKSLCKECEVAAANVSTAAAKEQTQRHVMLLALRRAIENISNARMRRQAT